ncbi:aldehyde dehydrogenase family protein [Salinibacterium sp. TMP30]|uniref:aldehyde dehydrogenase family protein n=1 Tax=Salinibacterium sp. TMP30 TaxID=3138237 RepID=UPI00313A2081
MTIAAHTPEGASSSAPASTGPQPLGEREKAELDAAVSDLVAGAAAWAAMPLAKRAGLLSATHTAMAAQAQRWATTASDIKGLEAASPLVGEEWISGPYAALAGVGSLAHSVAALAAGKSPLAGIKTGTAPGNRVRIPVLPHTAYEALLLHGFTAEVWLKPGATASDAVKKAGLAELTPKESGGVGLVLGAGNITSIPPLDVLYEIVANNRAVILKLNPIMADMMNVYLAALEPLVTAKLLRIVQGGAVEGSYLAHHPSVDHVHITGSSATHDTIVWGPGTDGAARKAAKTPLLVKPITSELGGVAPIILLPSTWTKRDLRYQAEHVATMRLHNGGYNCIAGQIVVLSADWPQKEQFLAELRAALERTPGRTAWYPGSEDRMSDAAACYPNAQKFAAGTRLLVDITAEDDATYLEKTETFSPVLGVIEVPGSGQAYLDAVVATVNRDFLGTLGANVIAEPSVITKLGSGFWEAMAELEYGTIAINAWTGVGFLTATASWGAFPGHTIDNVQSGIGVVHNALLIDSPERTVVRGPFRPFPRSFVHGEFALFPKPPWFVTARSAQRTGKLLAGFVGKPSWAKMPGIFISAFRA